MLLFSELVCEDKFLFGREKQEYIERTCKGMKSLG